MNSNRPDLLLGLLLSLKSMHSYSIIQMILVLVALRLVVKR
jgi:hypothetical protein